MMLLLCIYRTAQRKRLCPSTMDKKGQKRNISENSPLQASQNAQTKFSRNQLNCNHSAWLFSKCVYLWFVIWTYSAISILHLVHLADFLHLLKNIWLLHHKHGKYHL